MSFFFSFLLLYYIFLFRLFLVPCSLLPIVSSAHLTSAHTPLSQENAHPTPNPKPTSPAHAHFPSLSFLTHISPHYIPRHHTVGRTGSYRHLVHRAGNETRLSQLVGARWRGREKRRKRTSLCFACFPSSSHKVNRQCGWPVWGFLLSHVCLFCIFFSSLSVPAEWRLQEK